MLRSQLLNEPNAEESEKLDSLAEENRNLSQDLKERIQRLAQQPQGQDLELRRNRVRIVQHFFSQTGVDDVVDSATPIKVHGGNTELSINREGESSQITTES